MANETTFGESMMETRLRAIRAWVDARPGISIEIQMRNWVHLHVRDSAITAYVPALGAPAGNPLEGAQHTKLCTSLEELSEAVTVLQARLALEERGYIVADPKPEQPDEAEAA